MSYMAASHIITADGGCRSGCETVITRLRKSVRNPVRKSSQCFAGRRHSVAFIRRYASSSAMLSVGDLPDLVHLHAPLPRGYHRRSILRTQLCCSRK